MGVNVAVDDAHSYSWKVGDRQREETGEQQKKMAKRGKCEHQGAMRDEGRIGTGHITD